MLDAILRISYHELPFEKPPFFFENVPPGYLKYISQSYLESLLYTFVHKNGLALQESDAVADDVDCTGKTKARAGAKSEQFVVLKNNLSKLWRGGGRG